MQQLSKRYDYREYDRIWQRVSPGMEAYPATAGGKSVTEPTVREVLPPAAEGNCCLGPGDRNMVQVITGYMEEEWQARREYCQLKNRFGGEWSRFMQRRMACSEERYHRLQAAYYLITGECYRPTVVCVANAPCPDGCQQLRMLYHSASCHAINYQRSADSTPDPCLEKLFTQLSQSAFSCAEQILCQLEKRLSSL